jgi:hypothetical protein
MTAKQQAMIDMSSEGISVTFLAFEKAIIEFTATENSIKIDFRKFNGGYHPTKNGNK